MSAGDIQKELREALLLFVKRATKANATPEELSALPEVARVLKELIT